MASLKSGCAGLQVDGAVIRTMRRQRRSLSLTENLSIFQVLRVEPPDTSGRALGNGVNWSGSLL